MSGVVKIDEKFCNQDIQELYVSEGYSGKSIEIKINFKKYGIQDIVEIMQESYLGFEYGNPCGYFLFRKSGAERTILRSSLFVLWTIIREKVL